MKNSTTSTRKPRVYEAVVRALAQKIISGAYDDPQSFPTEEELGTIFNVSRTTVREAVKVLISKGMIETKPRTGIRVLPHNYWNLFDEDVLRWQRETNLNPDWLWSLLEARYVIEPAAAEYAARRASASDLAAIEAAYKRMEKALPDDLVTCAHADLTFHKCIVRASHNLVFEQLLGVIGASMEHSLEMSTTLAKSYEAMLGAHAALLEHIRLRQADEARQAAVKLLNLAAYDLTINIGEDKNEGFQGHWLEEASRD